MCFCSHRIKLEIQKQSNWINVHAQVGKKRGKCLINLKEAACGTDESEESIKKLLLENDMQIRNHFLCLCWK